MKFKNMIVIIMLCNIGLIKAMHTMIKNTEQQFAFEPHVINENRFFKTSKYVVIGMGGSHLAADLLKLINPYADIIIHSNYGLPTIPDLKERLIIFSSYSGNTEEVLDAYQAAKSLHLMRAVIAIGGALLEVADQDEIPYVQMPDFNLQPRLALALNLKSLLALMHEDAILSQLSELQHTFHATMFEQEGKDLSEKLYGYTPVIYSSEKNKAIAYNWKIKLNETGKIPAFYNVLPELNHNEMTGFDVKETTETLSDSFCFIFLVDVDDHPKIQKRMKITAQLLRERNLPVHEILLSGKNIFHKIFNSLVLADWTSFYTAEEYGLESEQVPMIEEFKKLMQKHT